MGSHAWMLYSILTMILWGLWGVFIKVASSSYTWTQVYVSSNMALLAVVTLVVLVYKPNVLASKQVFLVALAGGFMGTLGYISMIKALQAGPASVVVAATALYPAVTAVVSKAVLGEALNLSKALGIAFAIAAIVLLSR
jgi:transporter family protein